MTSKELEQIGVRRFGYGWQTKLAKEIGSSARSVRRWMLTGRVPEWVTVKLNDTDGRNADKEIGRE